MILLRYILPYLKKRKMYRMNYNISFESVEDIKYLGKKFKKSKFYSGGN
jgi:hypothetical protein